MKSETVVQQQVRLAMANLGGLPMRNNVGACFDETGRMIRYGLMNETKEMNKKFKSSDVVGPIPIVITQDMVGKTVGVFATLECKKEGWIYNPNDPHSLAQYNFIQLMRSVGCIAGFVTSPEHVSYWVNTIK